MSKKPTKQVKKTSEIMKEYTEEETRDLLKKVAHIECDPKHILKNFSKNVLPKILEGTLTKKEQETMQKKTEEALLVLGNETQYHLAESVGKRYQSLAMDFSRQVIKEYDCQSSSEKALVQVLANAYMRILEYSKGLHSSLGVDYLSNEKNGYYSMLSKELDRANRQFTTALTTLKLMKTPPLSISVKTKTAFVAQNQQLNVKQENNNENINPK